VNPKNRLTKNNIRTRKKGGKRTTKGKRCCWGKKVEAIVWAVGRWKSFRKDYRGREISGRRCQHLGGEFENIVKRKGEGRN